MSCYPAGKGPLCPQCGTNRIHERSAKRCGDCSSGKKFRQEPNSAAPIAPVPKAAGPESLADAIVHTLKRGPASLSVLSEAAKSTPGQVLDALMEMQARGLNVIEIGKAWSLEKAPATSEQAGRKFEYVSRPDNTFVFGATADNHLGSKYARMDCLNALYDRFAEAGADRVFNAGNWIDGEDHKNRFDLLVHGMEDQLRHLAERYPKRPGLSTYAVAGEDHEGFYCRREAVDIGKYAERIMREAGRDDWHDLGFIEAKVDLVNANTGKRGSLLVMHPGGGSAYALSYRAQKILESLEGGEKPSVLLIGHYHKMTFDLIRNVFAIQVGCTQDQTVFMRKKNLEAHVGGVLVTLKQDPNTGAITTCVPEFVRYFNLGYYTNGRWGKVGTVEQLPRIA